MVGCKSTGNYRAKRYSENMVFLSTAVPEEMVATNQVSIHVLYDTLTEERAN